VAVGLRLDWVVPVLGQHTALELADHLGALASRTDILGGHGGHAAQARLADVRVLGTVTAGHADNATRVAADVARTQVGLHLLCVKKNW